MFVLGPNINARRNQKPKDSIFALLQRLSNLYLNYELCHHAAMTPFRARLTLLSIMALLLVTAGNALFLQERPAVLRGAGSGKLAVQQPTSFELSQTAPGQSQAAPSKGPTHQAAPPSAGQPHDVRLQIALQRELTKHGYAGQLQAPQNGLRLAVLAYEFD